MCVRSADALERGGGGNSEDGGDTVGAGDRGGDGGGGHGGGVGDGGVVDEEVLGAGDGGRLLVADGTEGRVVVVDLHEGEAVASLSLQGPARLYPSSDAMRGFAVAGAHDVVEGIEPGIEYVEHGDHHHEVVTEPAVLSEVVVSCSRPVHFIAHAGYGAAFCDGDGQLHLFDDTGATETQHTFDSGRPHHGVGLVAFDHVLLSIPNPEDEADSLPVGVRVLSFEGEEQAQFDECPGLHGEASTGEHVCFGCLDGVLCLSQAGSGSLEQIKVAPPDAATEDLRVGSLAGSRAGALVGNWGEDLVRVDLKRAVLSPIPVGEPYLGFALSEDGAEVFVLTASGELRKIDLASGKPTASTAVFPEFEIEPGHGQLRPSFILGRGFAYVVDPRRSEIFELELETLEVTERQIALPEGNYHSLALVALPPNGGHH